MESNTFVTQENFDAIFDTYGSVIYGIVLRAAKNEVPVADMLTEKIFVQIYNRLKEFNSTNQRFITWAIHIAIPLMNQHGYRSPLMTIVGPNTKSTISDAHLANQYN